LFSRHWWGRFQGAFKIILKADIDKIKRLIAHLEYEEEHHPEGWTVEDATALADLRIELEALQEAYGTL
jgi:hypothetical protein